MRALGFTALSCLAACATVLGLDRDFEEVACFDGACHDGSLGPDPSPISDSGSPMPPVDPEDASAEAGDGSALTVTLVSRVAKDSVDFDVAADGRVLVLGSSPTRIERCDDVGCVAFVPASAMPPEETGANERRNASLGIFDLDTREAILVGQSGRNACSSSCTRDSPTYAGLYVVELGAPDAGARRLAPTLPLEFAKVYRSTNGWLAGDHAGFAVAQAWNDEAPTGSSLTYFAIVQPMQAPLAAERTVLGPIATPFTFASTTTPRGRGGYAALRSTLVDVRGTSVSAPVVPRLLAVTGGSPLAAHVVFIDGDTPADRAVVFANGGATIVPQDVPFPGLGRDTAVALFATERHTGFVASVPTTEDGGARVQLGVCRTDELLAKACRTVVLSTELDRVLRVRTQGSSVYVFGERQTERLVVRAELPL